LRVSKAGYYSGDPEKVLNSRVDHILAIIEYENFLNDYESAYMELNK